LRVASAKASIDNPSFLSTIVGCLGKGNTRRKILVLLCCVISFVALGAEYRLGAATSRIHEVFDVRDFEDSTNVTSLRGAILAINRGGGSGVIWLQEGTYTLTIQGADEFEGLQGDLNVTHGIVKIEGAGSNTVIDASSLGDRVLHVHKKAQLIVSGIVIRGGTSATGVHWPDLDGEPGGAILNEGVTIIRACTIRDNQSGPGGYALGNFNATGGGSGGPIYNKGSSRMSGSTVEANSCGPGGGVGPGGSGGGLCNEGTAILSHCVVADNAAGNPGDGANNQLTVAVAGAIGGGIWKLGTMRIYQCSIRGNRTGTEGWGARVVMARAFIIRAELLCGQPS
jgi:hypothetical protein